MRYIYYLLAISFFSLGSSCKKVEADLYFPLTQAQTDFIGAVHPGDTSIWENDLGLRDTAIVQPLMYDSYVMNWGGDGHEKFIGQRAYYLYRFLSAKKTKVADGIGVLAGDTSYVVVYRQGKTIATTATKEILTEERIHGVSYNGVFFCKRAADDSLFFNQTGYLGHVYEGEKLYKVK